jgi:hypothetical protein
MEREGRSKNCFTRVLYGVRKPGDKFHDVGAVKCSGSEEICERKSIKYWWFGSAYSSHKGNRANHRQTLSAPPAARFPNESTDVTCGL